MIYNSLFTRAIQKPQDPFVFFESVLNELKFLDNVDLPLSRTYPRWNLHKNFHSFSAETETLCTPCLDEIRPSCSLSYVLNRDHVITRTFPPDRGADDVQDLGSEFTVNRLGCELCDVFTAHIPLMVGEYVLVPGDSDERLGAKHLAHLAMTMRSALALWEVHRLKGPVVGFLMERNIVETKLGWIDDAGKVCFSSEA